MVSRCDVRLSPPPNYFSLLLVCHFWMFHAILSTQRFFDPIFFTKSTSSPYWYQVPSCEWRSDSCSQAGIYVGQVVWWSVHSMPPSQMKMWFLGSLGNFKQLLFPEKTLFFNQICFSHCFFFSRCLMPFWVLTKNFHPNFFSPLLFGILGCSHPAVGEAKRDTMLPSISSFRSAYLPVVDTASGSKSGSFLTVYPAYRPTVDSICSGKQQFWAWTATRGKRTSRAAPNILKCSAKR